MAANLTRLNVALTMTTAAFSRSAAAAQASLDKFGGSMARLVSGPMAALTGALSAGALIYGTKRAAENIDQMAKASDRLGVSMEFLGGLELLAKDTGVSVDLLEKSMVRLQKAVVDAGNGSKQAEDALRAFGLQAHQLVGLRADQQLMRVADAMNSLGTTAQKNAALIELFGKEGAQLNNALRSGSAGIKSAEEEAKQLGVTVSRLDAAKVEEMNDAFGRAGIAAKGALNNLAVAMAPIATGIAKLFTEGAKKTNGFKEEIDRLKETVVDIAAIVGNGIQTLGLWFQWGRTQTAVFAYGLVAIADAGVRAAEYIGGRFGQAWDMVKAGFEVLRESLALGWATIKIPFAVFIESISAGLATMLDQAAAAMSVLSKSAGKNISDAANTIRAGTSNMAVDAAKDFQKASDDMAKSVLTAANATLAFFSPLQTKGVEFINILKENFEGLILDEGSRLNEMLSAPWYGDRLRNAVSVMEQEAQANANHRATELAAEKAANDARLAEESRVAQERMARRKNDAKNAAEDAYNQDLIDAYALNLKVRADMDEAAEREKLRRQAIYKQEFGNFLNNLAVLQQSNDKRMRAIGKAAAKAKIVTDTAAAAMASYQSLAGIPVVGPALGAAAAAAAIAAGAVQLANVEKGSIGGGGGASASLSDSADAGGGSGSSRGPTQTLVVQGDYLTPETLARLFSEAKEKGITIEGVRRA